MRIARTLPPAAAPIYFRDIISGLKGFFAGQKELDRFKEELKVFFGVKHCLLLSSGKAALTLTLLALKNIAPERNRVIIPAYVCYSVPSAVVRAGLKVVLCDMQPNTLEMDLKQLSSKLTTTTLCVIVPHLFGLPARISLVNELCKPKGIFVIEDAAQAIGVTYNGNMLGSQGDVGFFSLGRGKTVSTVEGGILITNDGLIGRQLKKETAKIGSYTVLEQIILLLNSFLIAVFTRPDLYWFPKALPFLRLGDTLFEPDFSLKKMSGVQACLARGWQKKTIDFNNHRSKIAGFYIEKLSGKVSLSLFTDDKQKSVCLRFPVLLKKKDKEFILAESEKKGLGIIYTYPDAINGIPEINRIHKPDKQTFPVAKQFAQQIITLPVHPYISQKDKEKIVQLISEC